MTGTAGADPIIRFQNVTKRFGGVVLAVDQVSIDIAEGEFFALLGPSGCGKTTLLRMLAGFETPSEGTILIDGADMAGVSPNKRPVNMVFQFYAVFPHMSVAKNVGYGLRLEGIPSGEVETRVQEALDLVQLGEYGPRMPDQLSGGQRQRVALARALVKKPRVLLLDEPLSALDAKLREAMQLELVRLQKTVGITFVIVTHDQNEALSMADRIAVMQAGQVRQLAPPQELYEFPKSRFVADFIGKMNLFDGIVESGGVSVEGLGQLQVDAMAEHAAGSKIGVAVRPEKVTLSQSEPATDPTRFVVSGTVDAFSYHGNETSVFARTSSGVEISATVQNTSRQKDTGFQPGDTVYMHWDQADTLILGE